MDGTEVIERLRTLPGGPQVLELAARRDDVEVVGGAVRDLMLGETPREIDLVLDGSAASFPHAATLFARELATLLARDDGAGEPQISVHERFGTAAIRWSGGRVDIAARRGEIYPHPGALPQVSPGDRQQDLQRRDFTVNAIAVGLGGSRHGAVRAAPQALRDLEARQLRVLHPGSFADDPTRLLRLGRYASRLRFAIEPHTARLARQAIAEGAPSTVSAARIGAELQLALSEPQLLATLQALSELGVLSALEPPLSLDAKLLEKALALLPPDGRPELLALGALLMPAATRPDANEMLMPTATRPYADETLMQALERWEHPASPRRAVIEAATRAPTLAASIATASSPSQLWELLHRVSIEAVALAGAIASQAEGDQVLQAEEDHALAAAKRWLTQLRDVRLQISGDDLLAAGVQPGPEVGERLQKALRQRLDGTIDSGREAELQAALDR